MEHPPKVISRPFGDNGGATFFPVRFREMRSDPEGGAILPGRSAEAIPLIPLAFPFEKVAFDLYIKQLIENRVVRAKIGGDEFVIFLQGDRSTFSLTVFHLRNKVWTFVGREDAGSKNSTQELVCANSINQQFESGVLQRVLGFIGSNEIDKTSFHKAKRMAEDNRRTWSIAGFYIEENFRRTAVRPLLHGTLMAVAFNHRSDRLRVVSIEPLDFNSAFMVEENGGSCPTRRIFNTSAYMSYLDATTVRKSELPYHQTIFQPNYPYLRGIMESALEFLWKYQMAIIHTHLGQLVLVLREGKSIDGLNTIGLNLFKILDNTLTFVAYLDISIHAKGHAICGGLLFKTFSFVNRERDYLEKWQETLDSAILERNMTTLAHSGQGFRTIDPLHGEDYGRFLLASMMGILATQLQITELLMISTRKLPFKIQWMRGGDASTPERGDSRIFLTDQYLEFLNHPPEINPAIQQAA